MRAELGIEPDLPVLNGAQRQRRLLADGLSLAQAYRATVARTRETYAPGAGVQSVKEPTAEVSS